MERKKKEKERMEEANKEEKGEASKDRLERKWRENISKGKRNMEMRK